MTDDEMIEQAIDEFMGQVPVGDIVGHRSHRLSFTLVDVIDDMGICKLPDSEQYMFPLGELFDVNKVKARAVELVVAGTRRKLDRMCQLN